jgi:hypothetical protein
MKHLKIAGLCLLSMLVTGMALAGNASAALLWLLCLPKSTGLFSNPGCTTLNDARAGSWESESISNRTDLAVGRGFTIRLEDTGAIGGSSAIRCSGPGLVSEVTLESGGRGKITKAEIGNPKTECERVEGGCKADEIEKAEAVNMPWETEVFETEKKLLTYISSSFATEKEPGWVFECNTLLGKQVDTCVSPSRKLLELALLENRIIKNGGVEELLIYSAARKSNSQHCSQSGSNTGHIEAYGAILLSSDASPLVPTGLGLSINT